jgi:hypothetical protein
LDTIAPLSTGRLDAASAIINRAAADGVAHRAAFNGLEYRLPGLGVATLQAPAKAAAETGRQQRDQEQDDGDEKYDFRNANGGAGDAAKAKNTCDQSYDQ